MVMQRFYNAVMASKKRKRTKLEELLYKAMPYYDSDYDGDWSMDKLTEKILEITDGKEVVIINEEGKVE